MSLDAILHPSPVRRTTWRTSEEPSTAGLASRVTMSMTLVTVGSGPDSSIVTLRVRCNVRGGSAVHTSVTASRSAARSAGRAHDAGHHALVSEQLGVALCIACGGAVVGAYDKLHDLERLGSREAHDAGRIEASILSASGPPRTDLGITA